jgi:hypothetical protein
MKFLQVKDGVAIAVDKIKMITRSGDLSCKIHTSSDVYEVNIPFQTLMSILDKDNQDTMQKILNIMKTQGSFSG